MGPRLGRVEYEGLPLFAKSVEESFNGATLRTRGIHTVSHRGTAPMRGFNGATLRTRGILRTRRFHCDKALGFNGATLRTRGIQGHSDEDFNRREASMGPRLGRVEYKNWPRCFRLSLPRFNGATLRTRGIRPNNSEHQRTRHGGLQWGHA